VVLNVPPLPVALSRQGLQKKSAGPAAAGWTIRVASREEDGSPLSPVYCSYAQTQSGAASASSKEGAVSYYPLPPSFGSVHAGVSDETGKRVYGYAIAHAPQGGGSAFLLTFVNDGATDRRIFYHIDNLTPPGHGMTVAVWDGTKGAFEDFAAKGNACVAVAAGSKEYRTLMVGDAGYLAKARLIGKPSVLALIGTYPNPFRAMVRIRYSIPYAGVTSVKFAIYNLSGKVVWRHEVKDVAHSGEADLVWNAAAGNKGQRAAAAGIYIVRMTAHNAGNKPVAVFERKMTFMP
jgi:hypothetical protein